MVFADPFNADLMAGSILSDVRFYGAELHAFVVMGHHIHLLLVPPADMTMSMLMDRVKSNAGKRLVPHLSDELRAKLSIQTGLNKRTIWKRSFRGLPVERTKVFDQKANYIHMNPVRAGLCYSPEEFRWSSCWMYIAEKFDWDKGIIIDDDLVRHYCDPELLDIWNKNND